MGCRKKNVGMQEETALKNLPNKWSGPWAH